MVCWQYNDVSIWVYFCYFVGYVDVTCRSISHHRFSDDVFLVKFRNLSRCQFQIFFIGYHKNIFHRDNLLYPLKGLLYHGLSCSQDIMELFRKFSRTHRPKTASDAARHYDTIVIIWVHFLSLVIILSAPLSHRI